MRRVHGYLNPILVAALFVAAAAASLTTASFAADGPGSDLRPLDGAERIVRLIQGQENVLWVSLVGPVTQVTSWGWPTSDGEVELGGGMSITRPDGGESGTIDLGGQPMAVTFEVEESGV